MNTIADILADILPIIISHSGSAQIMHFRTVSSQFRATIDRALVITTVKKRHFSYINLAVNQCRTYQYFENQWTTPDHSGRFVFKIYDMPFYISAVGGTTLFQRKSRATLLFCYDKM